MYGEVPLEVQETDEAGDGVRFGGVLVTATLIAGAVAAPSATADSRHGWSHGQSREQRGAAVAADRAAKAGIDWQDCPADWGLVKPIQCGWVSVPLDYAHPHGKQIKLAVDRIGSTGTKRSARAPSSTTRAAPAARACASRPGSPARTRSG